MLRSRLRPRRWSALRIRTKGVIVVALLLLPILFFCLVLAGAMARQSAAVRAAGPPSARERAARNVQATILIGSLAFAAAGVGAALVVGNGLRRRFDMLGRLADGLGGDDAPAPFVAGDDEVGQIAARLREAGDKLRRQRLEIVAAGHSLDRFFHLSRDLFCIAGFDGYFKRLNPAWEITFGLSRAALMEKPFVEWIHPDDRERTLQEVAGLARGEDTLSFENRYQCADGGYRRLLWMARSSMAEGCIYASARDVTDERAAAENEAAMNLAIRHQADQLEASNRELEAFSYSVSHDLRAPLRAIDGFSQVIEEEDAARLSEAGRDALRRVRMAARRMGLLIDDLLNLSRVTRVEMHRGPIDLSALAAGVAADLGRRSPERSVTFDIAEGLTAHGDPRMLQVVLENLLENAWKYTGKTPDAHVTVSADTSADDAVFRVQDNGAGFDMKYAGRLFGAFQRLHSDREFEGTGIGLATVRRIVTRHGGRVWAEAAVGAGATFCFTLGRKTEER